MNNSKDFNSFYQSTLLPTLEELEGDRKKIVKNIYLYAIPAAAIAVVAFLYTSLLLMILVAGLGAYVYFTHIQKIRDLQQRFKEKVVGRMVKFVDESLQYQPSNGIGSGDYHKSQLFLTGVDRYKSEDMVIGLLGKTAFRFSEVHSEQKHESHQSNGNKSTRWETIFRGIFFIADFNKKFNGRTVVLPDLAERALGSLGSFFQKMNVTRDTLVKLENPEFEKAFVVYGTDQTEARYILSPTLMERIVAFRNKTGNVHLSFIDSQVFIAITVRENLFEAPLFRTLLNFERMEKYNSYLALSVGIVEDLDLNTRIWTKV